jgi:hypothetical protein
MRNEWENPDTGGKKYPYIYDEKREVKREKT